MSLVPGTFLGAYEVLSLLGAGGMGEVYRARDTRLGREVAIKILPPVFASDPERLARFEREAHVLAALNHPNIAAIYGFEDGRAEAGHPVHALVLELVDGPTLADRIAQGPIPLDEALPIARQIAEALGAAHEQGVIHRDLKPANIKVTPDGVVKVLDFGLAKLASSETAAAASAVSMSPTITSPVLATGAGVLLGTAAYMSPEQAKGKPADKRADVWAFGCVLYEMLTGKRAFEGEDVTETLARILMKEPDWEALPASVSPAIRTVLARALTKERRERISDVSAALFVLKEAASLVPPAAVLPAVPPPLTPAWRRVLPWSVAIVTTSVALTVLAVWMRAPDPPAAPVSRLSIELGGGGPLGMNQGAAVVLSPDGRRLAFTARRPDGTYQLFIRSLDQLEATLLAGTAGAYSPFFSPDGQWVAFFADTKLKKISVTGGAALTIADAPQGRGGWWGDDGFIVFTPSTTRPVSPGALGAWLMRVPSNGGVPQQVSKGIAEVDGTQRFPQVLPGGKGTLYTANTAGVNWDDATIAVEAPDGTRKVLHRGGYYARYVKSGHLVWIREDTLFAAPFDIDRLELTASAVPIVEGVTGASGVGGGQFSVSDTGLFAYVPGAAVNDDAEMVWMDQSGKTAPLRSERANWASPAFSPDGRLLAMEMASLGNPDIWVYDLTRDALSRLTFDAALDTAPTWTPDGRRIAYRSTRDGESNLYWQRADGTGEVQRLTESRQPQRPRSFHPNGRLLAFHEDTGTGSDLMILSIEGDETTGWKPGKSSVFLKTPFAERHPTFSPDGKWLAYSSNVTGRFEIYVRPYPGPGGQWQVSTEGGSFPWWSTARQELLYLGADGRVMASRYAVIGDAFTAEKPTAWAEPTIRNRRDGHFALHPQRNQVAVAPNDRDAVRTSQEKVVLILNFFDELRRLAPTN